MSDRYTIYTNKDGRTRVYDKITKKVTSYPRFLMAAELGRPLTADEQVHHKDGNPLNNIIDNLEVLSHCAALGSRNEHHDGDIMRECE